MRVKNHTHFGLLKNERQINHCSAKPNRLAVISAVISVQRAKKFVSDSPGLVDFVVGLVDFILYLPKGQVKVFGGNI